MDDDYPVEDIDDEPRGIYAALARAQAKFPAITKGRTATVETRTGGHYTYNYADIADVLAAVRPILAAEGIAIVQRTDVLAVNGHVLVTTLYHTDGSSIESQWRLRDRDDPQSVGADLTYFRRYQLSALIGVATEDDDDANRSKQQREPQQERRRPASLATPEQKAQVRTKITALDVEQQAQVAEWMRQQGIYLNRESTTVDQLVELHRHLNTLITEPFEVPEKDETILHPDDGQPVAENVELPEGTTDDGVTLHDFWFTYDDEQIGAEVTDMVRADLVEWLRFFDQPTTGAVGELRARLITAWMYERDHRAPAADTE